MERWRRGAWLAATALALLGGCAAPPVRYPPDRGHPFDPECVAGFQRGVTTREEALRALGEPSTSVTHPEDGSTTLTWEYVHADAAGTLAQGVLLTFDAQDRLLLKFASSGSRAKAGGTPTN